MKLKSEKGFTLIDITVALIVLLSFMSLIAVLFFNITKTSRNIERDDEATYLATSIIEDVKAQEYDNIAVTNNNVISSDNISAENGKMVSGSNASELYKYKDETTINVGIPNGYTCKVAIQNYVPENKTNGNTDLVKLVLVQVQYKLGGQIKTVQLKTSIVNTNV